MPNTDRSSASARERSDENRAEALGRHRSPDALVERRERSAQESSGRVVRTTLRTRASMTAAPLPSRTKIVPSRHPHCSMGT